MPHGPEFRIVTQGIREVTTMFKGIGARAADCRPVMLDIYLDALGVIKGNFESESARGDAWAPLTKTTLLWRRRMGYTGKILHATGELEASMTTPRHPLQYSRVEAFKVVINSRTIKGKAHQRGYSAPIHVGKTGMAPTVRVPARPYVAFNAQDRRRYAYKILVYISARRFT